MGYQITNLLTTEYWAKYIGNWADTSGSTTKLCTFGQAQSFGCKAYQGSWASNQLVPVEALATNCNSHAASVGYQGDGCYKYIYTYGQCRDDNKWRLYSDVRYAYVGGGYTYTSGHNSAISQTFSC